MEHDGNLLNILEVCRKNNLTLNAEKMQFRLPKVSFFGHTWSDCGLSPDPKKIEVVKRMELPQDVETKFPRLSKLSQQIQPSFSRLK